MTVFVSIADPLADQTEALLDEVFGDLEVDLGGIGAVVGWDVDADGVRLYLEAEEPERVMPVVTETLRKLDGGPG